MDQSLSPKSQNYNPYLDDLSSPLKDKSADSDFFADENNISISECNSEDGIEDDEPGKVNKSTTS
jgi:hypothetical protein